MARNFVDSLGYTVHRNILLAEDCKTTWGRVEKIWAMRQRKLGSHMPPCHRRMVITTLFSVFLAALQRGPVLCHTRWLLLWGGGGGDAVPQNFDPVFNVKPVEEQRRDPHLPQRYQSKPGKT